MATSQISDIMQHLRRTVLLQDGSGLTDGQLLGCFIEQGDAAAFAALVRRHGPMVWSVCRRLLNQHDAEDAFQATFLVLVRKAASITSRDLLANWLYGVAHQTALKARATVAKRKGRERQMLEMPEPAATEQDLWCDLEPLLDQELSRLPDKYRSVIVLCDLEGKTRKEAAQLLGVPEGTVASRMATARTMLAKRLSQRGLAVSSVALAAVLTEKAASAGVPTSVLSSTIKAVTVYTAGQAAATGVISVKIAALAEGVLKAMLLSKIRAAVVVVLAATLLMATAGMASRYSAGRDEPREQSQRKRSKVPVNAEKRSGGNGDAAANPGKARANGMTWGEEAGGLQIGVGVLPADKWVYRLGQAAELVLKARNVSKAPIAVSYTEGVQFHRVVLLDAQGRSVPVSKPAVRIGFRSGNKDEFPPTPPTVRRTLKPGEEIEVGRQPLVFESEAAAKAPGDEWGEMLRGTWKPTALVVPGKYKVGYAGVSLIQPSGTPYGWPASNPPVSPLSSGKIEVEVLGKER